MSLNNRRPGFHLLDLIAVMVGFALASMLTCAYWPDQGVGSIWEVLVLVPVFGWLGFAMSGPVVLMIRRPPATISADDERPGRRTWSEMSWLIIGFYWIGLTIVVVPARIRGTRILDSAILGLFPVLAALGLRFFGPKELHGKGGEHAWTHQAAIWLLLLWPFVWVGMMVLGKNVP